MTTDRSQFDVSGVTVDLLRKDIKNLHLAVYPPNGRVRVAAPRHLDDEEIRLAVITRLPWIRRKQAAYGAQDRQSEREFVTGESHFFQGRRYRLRVIEGSKPYVQLAGKSTLELGIRPGTNRHGRAALLQEWYRSELQAVIQVMVPRWQPLVGVELSRVLIRKMKTRWGTCDSTVGRITLNLELAKKPLSCVEYVMVHEMIHMHERLHNDRFLTLMNKAMPKWRVLRDELNRAPLAHEDWAY